MKLAHHQCLQLGQEGACAQQSGLKMEPRIFMCLGFVFNSHPSW